jgi:meso-butanediol dehydrogenase/(S,S)-butanediol dehydrogenase/diacetyl reductase
MNMSRTVPRSTRLAGSRAVVTGGGRGIGRAIVERLRNEGARVLTCGRGARPADLPDEVHWITANVAVTDGVAALRDAALTTFGGIDCLVNNAGVLFGKTVLETTDGDYEHLMGVNARGMFLCCRAFIPVMAAVGGGAIVNLGSSASFNADPVLALYNASKAFVVGLTRSIAVDHGHQRIRCNAVCPGWIATEMIDPLFAQAGDPDAAKRDALARHPLGRLGTPAADVAATVAWLVSEDAAFVTGQSFVIDGGMLAASPIRPDLEHVRNTWNQF